MEMEARSFSPERARALLQKVKEYKADLASLRQEAKQVQLASTCVMCLSQPYRV
jgi:vesicle transport through interaction with t-SNAREs 1